jgi:hypothetical protein
VGDLVTAVVLIDCQYLLRVGSQELFPGRITYFDQVF